MKHLVRGTAGLVAAIGVLAGCADDPALDLAGAPTRILVNPSFLFVPQGDSQAVLVRTINDLNDAVLAKYEITNVGAGVSVGFDAAYRPDYNNPGDTLAVPELKYQQRYFVKALSPVATSFQVRNGNLTAPVQVRVVPTNIPLAFSGGNGTTEPATTSAPNFRFSAATRFEIDGVELPITGIADDGSSVGVVVPGGLAGAIISASDTRVAYAPTVTLPTLNAPPVTTPAATAIAGTDGAGSAPTLTAAAQGPWGFIDKGAFSGPDYVDGDGPTKVYKIVITTDRAGQDLILDWGANAAGELADLDFFLIDEAFENILARSANINNDEHPPEVLADIDLPAGTYYLLVLNFENLATPDWFSILLRDH